MPRQDGRDRSAAGHPLQPLQRGEVRRELPSGQATTVVPRPSTVSPVSSAPSAGRTKETESPVWPGVATTAARGRPPAPGRRPRGRRGRGRARAPGAPVSSANRAAASAWSLWPWVSSVWPPAPAAGDASSTAPGGPRGAARGRRRRTSVRPRLGQHPRVRAVQGHRARGWAPARRRARSAEPTPGSASPAQPPVTAAARSGRRPRRRSGSAPASTRRMAACSASERAQPRRPAPPPRRRPRSGAASSPARPLGPQHGRRAAQSAWSASVVGRRPPGRPASARRRTGCRSGAARTRG